MMVPNKMFIRSKAFLVSQHILIIKFFRKLTLFFNFTMNKRHEKYLGKMKNELIISALILICYFISTLNSYNGVALLSSLG